MAWEIKVSHEQLGDQTRLTIEAGTEVPDEVISSIAGSYWLEQVQISDEEWEGFEDPELSDPNGGPPAHMHG